jgi:starch synthase (maltosyl-transferring)
MRSTAPRIYNLHPLLAGSIDRWPDHLPRAAAMGFDWVYVNAFFEPGASGSIYAVRDPWQLHPKVRGSAGGDSAELVRGFTEQAHEHGLAVMVDLIVPHAAKDSRLAEQHPEWLRRGPDGGVVEPTLANPTDPRRPRHMDDLAEIELGEARHRAAQLDYFTALASHFLALGAAGFRCSAAYKVPPDFWRELIARIRQRHPHTVFLAAALGCPFEQVRGLAGCGFDLIFDSSRWWDFHGGWFLDQHDELRRIASTVAFPEDHNTPRLAEAFDAHEPDDMARLYRARWLIASFIGTGVLMPMGYEFGCRRRLDPIHSSPEQWLAETREPVIDLQDFIAATNTSKRETGVLQVPGPLRRVSAPNARCVALLRLDAGTP